MYILNAFSLQMVSLPCTVKFTKVDTLPEGLESAIGHKDTAELLGYEMNRVNVHLKVGDVAYIAQFMGGRLAEGCTTLKEGSLFTFIKAEVLE